MRIHLVIEEAEAGSFADGTTYCVLSAHATQSGADAAVDAWRDSHGEPAHALVEDPEADDWCVSCGAAVVQDAVTLEGEDGA